MTEIGPSVCSLLLGSLVGFPIALRLFCTMVNKSIEKCPSFSFDTIRLDYSHALLFRGEFFE
jgi:hypothetical protein